MLVITMDKKHLILMLLLVTIFGRLIVFPMPFTNNLITGNDHGAHIHKIQIIKTYGDIFWDPFWYAGTPLTRFYPPLSFYIASLIPFNEIDAYLTAFILFFALTPVVFYYLLKEFKLSLKQRVIALLLFSFTMYYNSAVFFGQYPTIVSVFFSILFLKFFIRGIRNKGYLDLLVSGLFLGLTALTHELATIMIVFLSLVYLLSFYYIKRDKKKLLKSAIPYVAGFLVSAFWSLPFLLERSYSFFESGSPTYAGLLGSIPFTGILRLYAGLSINFISILIAVLASVLLLFALIKNFKKDVESLFLFLSTFLFLAAYFVVYFFASLFVFDPTRFIVLWPIPFSIIIAKLWNQGIFKWLILALLITQLVLFFGTPMPMSSSWVDYKDSLSGLENAGRVTIQPEELLYIVSNYVPALNGFEEAYGNLDMGLTSSRASFIEKNRLFKCFEAIPLSSKIFSLDVFSRQYQAAVPCKLYNDDYKNFFKLEYVKYVVVNKKHAEVSSIFENNPDFSKVKEGDSYSIYSFNQNISYVDSGLKSSFVKDTNSITVRLYSDQLLTNVPVRLSESWYPYWKSKDVQIKPDENGFISFTVPGVNGEKEIRIELETPWYVDISKYISIVSVLLILVYSLFSISYFKDFKKAVGKDSKILG